MRRNVYAAVIAVLLSVITGCSPMMKAELDLIKAGVDVSRGRYDEGISLYQNVLAVSPDLVRARSGLGYAFLKADRVEESVAEFKKALELEPGDPYSILYLGVAYLKQREYNKATETWKQYRNKEKPFVEKEVKRLLTIVAMTRAQEQAVKAMAEEEKLGAQSLQPNTIAIGYFKDLSRDNSFRAFQKGLTAMLITDISKIRKLTVVERAKLQSLLEELKLGQTGIVDESSAPRVGKLLKAESIVTGTLNEGSIEVALAVASAGSSGIKGVASAGVEKNRFFELPPLIIEKIAEILNIQLSSEERRAIGIPHTRNYSAFIYYGSALDALDRGNWEEAKDLFDRALTEDPRFLLAGEGVDSSPGTSSPSIDSIKSLDIAAIVVAVENSIKKAYADQDAADEAEELDTGGGGGH